jgi:hypothetical protein
MRYDRARGGLDRHATYIVTAYVAGAAERIRDPATDEEGTPPARHAVTDTPGRAGI